MDDKSIKVLGVLVSCKKGAEITSTLVTPSGEGNMERLRVDQVTMERRREMRSLERRGEKRRDKGVTAVSSHSVTPGLAVFTELSVT